MFKMSIQRSTCINKPLVIILGATATGKTKLSVEIASKYNGEVVNADAMQMYQGLEIITNKATKEERKGIPHHLIGFIAPQEASTVIDFRNKALKIINTLHDQNKLPVVVGGTFYYLEALLYDIMAGYWKEDYLSAKKVGESAAKLCANMVGEKYPSSSNENSDIKRNENSDVKSSDNSDDKTSENSDLKCRVMKMLSNAEISSNDLYKILQEVDPKRASVYHNNDSRKVRRAIEIWLKTGRKVSDIYSQQQIETGKISGGAKRFENVIILWLKSEKDVLAQRQNERVTDMLYRGLLEEVTQFHHHYNKNYMSEDVKYDKRGYPLHYQQGVFQCIGFKEFHEYLMLSQEDKDSKLGRKKYLDSILLMQQRTRRYSKTQEKWIKKRFLSVDRHTFPVYELDSTDPSKWDDVVTSRVNTIMDAFLQERQIPFEAHAVAGLDTSEYIPKGDQTRHHCDLCEVILLGKEQYHAHMNGGKHARMVARNKLAMKTVATERAEHSPPEKKQALE